MTGSASDDGKIKVGDKLLGIITGVWVGSRTSPELGVMHFKPCR